MTVTAQKNRYLAALRGYLRAVPAADCEEILREIEAHIRDAMEEDGIPVDEALARLGSPEQLAAAYQNHFLIRHASHSFSPVVLLRATLRVATKGFFGMLVFLSGLFGYLIGGGLIITAFIKPFLPTHTGLFVGPHNYGMGIFFPGSEGGERELLGWWYIPAALVLGSLLLILTTAAIRIFLRTSRQWQRSAAGISPRGGRAALATVAAMAAACIAAAGHP